MNSTKCYCGKHNVSRGGSYSWPDPELTKQLGSCAWVTHTTNGCVIPLLLPKNSQRIYEHE